ncbi:MAG: DUF169 domain-containing protein [Alistipes sp.]
MEQLLRDRFTTLWRRYFNHAELPLTFEYVDDTRCEQPEPAFAGHRCLIGQLIKARNGRTLCLTPESISCRGAGRYLSFREGMFPGFAEFIAHNAAGNGERYRQTPEMVTEWINSLAVLPIRGRKLIVKRWDQLCAEDQPDGVIFFAEPDVLSGLFTLAGFGDGRPDAVIAPFGAGCTSIFYLTYREQTAGTARAIIGMFDPSARKCVKNNLLSFAVPYIKFVKMIDHMEESFLSTPSWEIIQRRIK